MAKTRVTAVSWMLVLALLSAQCNAQPQAPTSATVTLPAQVVVSPSPAPVQPAPGPVAAPTPAAGPAPVPPTSPAPPTPPLQAAAPLLPPAAECERVDTYIKDNYDVFFLLTRLIDSYTLQATEPSPPLNASYTPLTILAPKSTIDFLQKNNINIRELAASPLQSILLAPTVASHFVRGYFPADALPVGPVPTLCGATCGDVQFVPTGGQAQVRLVNSPQTSVNITEPNVAQCPGQWVIHEVSGYLYQNVTDPVAAAAPALDMAYALGGEWDTYNVAGTKRP